MSDEKRQDERIQLEVDFRIRTCGKELFLGILRNISLLGMKLELADERRCASLAVGETVTLEGVSDPLREHVRGKQAEIVWLSGTLVGVRFFEPLDIPPDAILEFQHRVHVQPFLPEDARGETAGDVEDEPKGMA